MEQNRDRGHYHDQEPRFKEHGTSRLREHFRQGMTLFIVIISCIICYFAFLRFDAIAKVIGKIVDILKPIIYGLVIAYLLNPIMKKVELLFEKLFFHYFMVTESRQMSLAFLVRRLICALFLYI